MSTTDWDSVTVIRKHNNTRPTVSKDAKTVNNAFREGNVITGKKCTLLLLLPICKRETKIEGAIDAAGSNLARNMTTDKNTARIADEVDAGHVEHVNRSVSETIQKARMDHEPTMKQSDLAKLINEKPNVIQQYESGQAM